MIVGGAKRMPEKMYMNHFVPRTMEALLDEDQVHEIRIKRPDGLHCNFNCDHAIMMKIIDQYGLKPKWKKWERTEAKNQKGETYTKLVEVDADSTK